MRNLLKFFYFICILGYNILNVYFAKIIMDLTDSLSGKSSEAFFRNIGIGAVAVVGLLVFNFIYIILQNYIIRDEMQKSQCKGFAGILFENKRELKEDEYNKQYSFLTKEIDLYENNFVKIRLSMISSLIMLVASGGMIFNINHKLLIPILIMVFAMVFVPFYMNGKLRRANDDYLKTNEKLYARTGEFLHGFETIRAYFAEKEILKQYHKCVADNNEKKRILSNKLGFTNAITAFFGIVIVFVTFIVGGKLVFEGELTIGAIFATVQLVTNMINPLTELLYGMNEISAVRPIADKIKDIEEKKIEFKDYEFDSKRVKSVNLKNVSFMYEKQNKNFINNLSMSFEKGKLYAIVGENGSGKSTLAKLIAGYNIGYSGEILLGEKELKSIDYPDLRKHVAYINQNPFVFDSTAYDNCTIFGKYDINSAASKAFECDNMLLNKEKSAINLSGGEKQKLIFLRSLNLDFDIIIYDEVEASMDILARKKLLKFLAQQKNKIIICISHCVDESLDMYDEIIYLKKGSITEKGSFRQLYDNHGEFYDYYNKKIS